jgi:hypothetical protein
VAYNLKRRPVAIVKINELEADWTNRGFSFGIDTIKAHDGINEVTHDYKDELVYMESRKYEFTIVDKTFTQ